MTLIQTVWFRVMTFVWFPPPTGKENNFNLKVFFLQRIAAANRRTKKVPRILERKYSKLGTSDVAAFGNKKQLRTVKGVKFALNFSKLLPLNYLKQRLFSQIVC